jgi:hypothetical protein
VEAPPSSPSAVGRAAGPGKAFTAAASPSQAPAQLCLWHFWQLEGIKASCLSWALPHVNGFSISRVLFILFPLSVARLCVF